MILNRSGESWQFCAWSQWLEYQFSIVTYDVDIGFDVNCHYYLKAHFFHSNFIEFYFNLIMNGYLMLSKTLTKSINMFECFICLIVLIMHITWIDLSIWHHLQILGKISHLITCMMLLVYLKIIFAKILLIFTSMAIWYIVL